jgi:hypothetical protein
VTSPKVAGLRPDEAFQPHRALEFAQPVTAGAKADILTDICEPTV